MNIPYWIERLLAEAKRQRGKTLVLAAITVLAACLWLPHLWSALRGAAPQADASEAQPAAPSSAAAANPRYWKRWKTWKESLDTESQQPLRHGQHQLPDPFSMPAAEESAEASEPQDEPAHEPPPPPVVTPQEAGLRLESTLSMRGDDGAAGINGKVYRMGQQIMIKQQPSGFRLIDVAARHVTIERHGRHFSLELPARPGASIQTAGR